jgi:uncharacterized protein (DUF1499 family)
MIRAVLILAAFAAALLLVAGPGVRLELWQFPVGFQLLKYGAYAGGVAAALAVVLLLIPRVRRAGGGRLLLAFALGATSIGLPWLQLQQARSVPPIHDISTDTDDPPAFVATLALRADARNSADYGGAAIAAQQRQAYPDIQPLLLPVAGDRAFAAALDSAEAMGWTINTAEAGEGRIEATATTLWFGFKDDVVIRLRPDGDGTRVDVRSLSRVGQSDVGANAKRIRAYLARLKQSTAA